MSRALRSRRTVATVATGLFLLTACGGNGAGSSSDAAGTGQDVEAAPHADAIDAAA